MLQFLKTCVNIYLIKNSNKLQLSTLYQHNLETSPLQQQQEQQSNKAQRMWNGRVRMQLLLISSRTGSHKKGTKNTSEKSRRREKKKHLKREIKEKNSLKLHRAERVGIAWNERDSTTKMTIHSSER